MQRRHILPPTWKVPDAFRDRLGNAVGRQRLMQADGHLLLVLHQIPGADEQHRRGRFLWRDNTGTWHGSDTGAGISAVRKHLDEYAEAIEQFEGLREKADKADDFLKLVEGLAPLVRAAKNLYQVFQEAREKVAEDRDLIDFRDRAYEINRNAELLYDDAKNAMDVAIVRRAEEQAVASRRMATAAHRLNRLAAFFFPLATISSIFGSGLQHGWEAAMSPPLPFYIMIGIGLFAGICLTKFLGRAGQ